MLDKILESPTLALKLLPFPHIEGGGRRKRGQVESSEDPSEAGGEARAAKRKSQMQKKKEKTAREEVDDDVKAEIQSLRMEKAVVEGEGKLWWKEQRRKATRRTHCHGRVLPRFSMTFNGKRLCVGYNLGERAEISPGEQCTSGCQTVHRPHAATANVCT